MKKSDLETGMIVKTRDGKMRLMISGTAISYNDGGGVSENFLNEDLTSVSLLNGDIDAVFSAPTRNDSYNADMNFWFKNNFKNILKYCTLLWERKEEKIAVTLDGVEYSESTLRSLIKKATDR